MNVAQRVQTYIKAHGIKQSHLAEKCGWSKQRTSLIVRGEKKMTAEEMANICEAVGVPYDFFYNMELDNRSSA